MDNKRIIFGAAYYEEYLPCDRLEQDMQMMAAAGMSYNQFTRPGGAEVDGERVSHWIELLKPTTAETAARYEHKYWGAYAAVTRNDFAKGHAWYVGTMLSQKSLQKYLLRAAADAGIEVSELRFPLVERSAVTRDDRKLRFLLNYSDAPASFPSRWSGTDLLSGTTCAPGQEIALPDWGVCVLEER